MVFNDLPKCLRCNAQPSVEMPTLANLAHEIQLQIFRDVDTLWILRLRLTCSGMVPSSNTILHERLKTLYIHPRYIEKLSRFADIPFSFRRWRKLCFLENLCGDQMINFVEDADTVLLAISVHNPNLSGKKANSVLGRSKLLLGMDGWLKLWQGKWIYVKDTASTSP